MSQAALRRNRMLQAFDPADIGTLEPHLRRAVVVQGQVLYEVGDEVDQIYFPLSGLLTLTTPTLSGYNVDCLFRGRDGGVGYVEACGSGYIASRVVTQIPGEVVRVSARAFCEAHAGSASLRSTFARRVEFLLSEIRQSLTCQALHPAAARLGRLLLELGDRTGETRFPLAQEMLATMLGVGRTTVTHAALELRRRKLISYTRGSIEVADRRGLEGQVCECYHLIRDERARILGFAAVGDASADQAAGL